MAGGCSEGKSDLHTQLRRASKEPDEVLRMTARGQNSNTLIPFVMKKILTLICACLLACQFSASAQKTAPADDLTIIQAAFGMEKMALIKSYMDDLPADKTVKFWEVYDKYEQARQNLVRKHLVEFAKITVMAEALDDKAAAAYGKERGRYEAKVAQLHKKYFCKMNSAVGGFQALKFMQAELYIENVVQLELQSHMPFIGEIEVLVPKN